MGVYVYLPTPEGVTTFSLDKMAREGIPFIAVFVIPAIIFGWLGWWVAMGLCLVLAFFMVFFFRDPERQCPTDESLIVSPADGRVVVVAPIERSNPGAGTQVSIFLSPLDVHINRSPVAGEITEVVYKKGAFHVASRDIASVENEQNIVTVRAGDFTIVFRQIAGVLARRVVLWKKPGDRLKLGERIGLMKFGSRMDVLLPAGIEVMVRKNDRVIGGITIIGRMNGSKLS